MSERNIDAIFADIAAQYTKEIADPAMEPLFDTARRCAEDLAVQRITKEKAAIIAHDLNELLVEAAGSDRDIFVRISGKCRLSDENMLQGLHSIKEAPHLYSFQSDVTRQFDADFSSYYPLHRQLCAVDKILVQPASEEVDGKALYRIVYYLSISKDDYDEYAMYMQDSESEVMTAEDYLAQGRDEEDEEDEDFDATTALATKPNKQEDPQSLTLMMYAEDVVSIELSEISPEKKLLELQKHFPEIAQRIEAIPQGDFGNMETINAVKNLALVFDWSNTPYRSQDQRDGIINMVGEMLRQKVTYDLSMHKISFIGPVSAVQVDGTSIKKVQQTRRDLYGIVASHALREVEDDSDDSISELYPVILISAPSPHEKNKDNLYSLPFASIMEVSTIRNEPFFDEELRSVPTRVESQDRGDVEVNETIDVEHTMNSLDARRPTDSELLRYLTGFEQLWAQIATFEGQLFHTENEARETAAFVHGLIQHFLDKNDRLLGQTLQFRGEAIEYTSGPIFDAENILISTTPLIVKRSENELLQGDDLTIKIGRLTRDFRVSVAELPTDEGIRYGIISKVLVFEDKYNSVLQKAPEDSDMDIAYYSEESVIYTYFSVELTQPGSVEMPVLEAKKRLEVVAKDLAAEVADTTMLVPVYLDELQTDILTATGDRTTSIRLGSLQAINQSIEGSEKASGLAAEALSNILDGQQVSLQGAIYNKAGEELGFGTVQGKLLAVVEQIPNTSVNSLVIVMDLSSDGTYYVPISSLTKFTI